MEESCCYSLQQTLARRIYVLPHLLPSFLPSFRLLSSEYVCAQHFTCIVYTLAVKLGGELATGCQITFPHWGRTKSMSDVEADVPCISSQFLT